MKKEDLQKELGSLEREVQGHKDYDKKLRGRFAKAFDWYTTAKYSNDKEYTTPAWEDIFVQVGRLLEKRQSLKYVIDTDNLIQENMHIWDKIKQIEDNLLKN